MTIATTHADIDRLLATGNIARAAALAERALAAGDSDPMLLNLAAWAREDAGDLDGAMELLGRALVIAPGDPLIIAAQGRVLRLQGHLSAALVAIDRALAAAPDNPSIWLERGFTLDMGNSLAAAKESYARAVALDPHLAQALAGLASVAARTGDRDTGRRAGEAALAIDPLLPMAVSALARIEIEAGDAGTAAMRLGDRINRPGLMPADRLLLEGLRGDALARTGATAAAFQSYTASNRAFEELQTGRFANALDHRAHVEAVVTQLAATAPRWPRIAPSPVPGEAQTHVFLLGYPRSGNTLAENILASLPGVAAIEERPTLAGAECEFLIADDGIARLAALDAAGAQPWRAAYWAKVAACGVDAGVAMLVDMDPLKSVQLPLISRLFPDARVVLMRRDPRDVVWSCFRTSFAANPSTREFVSLERAARHYDATMRLTDDCLARLPLNVEIVRYEDLVADFDATTRRLCVFVGAKWTEALRAFDKTAQRRGVSTASASQVRRGLYDGSGQWRPFAGAMAEVLPILAPWVERFAYPAR